MKVVAGDQFGADLANELQLELLEVDQRVFPDGEVCPRVKQPNKVKESSLIVVQRPQHPLHPNRFLFQTCSLLKNLQGLGAGEVTLLLPYLPYAQQDKVFRDGEPFSSRYVLEMLRDSGAGSLLTVSPHFQRQAGSIDLLPSFEARSIDGTASLLRFLQDREELKEPGKDLLVLSPDLGASDLSKIIADGLDATAASFKKERDRETGEISFSGSLSDVEGKTVLIVDDLVETGGTLRGSISRINEQSEGQGPKEIYAAVIHPVLAKNSLQKFKNSKAQLFVSNSIDLDLEGIRNLSQFSLVPEVAQQLRNPFSI